MKRPALLSFLPGPLDVVARETFLNDCLRQLFVGLLDTGPRTFFLLIAVQRFSADDLFKTLITIPGSIGMTLSVILIPVLSRYTRRKTAVLAATRLFAALCFLAASAFPSLEAYVFWMFLGGMPSYVVYPLLTAVYRENYPRRFRGQLFAWAAMVNTASSMVWHAVIGAWLGPDSEAYRSVLILFGLASLLAAWSLFRIPSPARKGEAGGSLLGAIRWVWKDRTFGYMLMVWFIFGFAVMMMTPLKILFLTEARYGLSFPAPVVALVIGILPEGARLITTPVWARLFDRFHFVGIRMFINIILLIALVAFFWGRTLPWLCFSAVMEGMVLAGGSIAWALWVTHVAPERHTAEYMAVHQFFTGVRGVLGAILGIRLASAYGLQPVAWGAVSLVILSILLMLPARNDRRWVRAEGASENLP